MTGRLDGKVALITGTAGGQGRAAALLFAAVCTAESLAETCRREGGIYNPRHHLVMTFEEFDQR